MSIFSRNNCAVLLINHYGIRALKLISDCCCSIRLLWCKELLCFLCLTYLLSHTSHIFCGRSCVFCLITVFFCFIKARYNYYNRYNDYHSHYSYKLNL